MSNKRNIQNQHSDSNSLFSNIDEVPRTNAKGFLIGGAIWSVIYLVIPLIIWAFTQDFKHALSINGKVGIGMIGVSFFVLGARDKVIGTSQAFYQSKKSNTQDMAIKESEHEAASDISLQDIFAPFGVWMLLWGIIFVVPFAFGIPFIYV